MKNKILELFLFNDSLKFSEIEKALNIRSNKLAYNLNKLVKNKIIIKEKEKYLLNRETEQLIPYLSNKNATLPAVLICIGNSKECFLHRRKKRPFKDMLSLPGGRLVAGETIEQAVERITKDHKLKSKLTKIHSITLEHVKKDNEIIHSFLLILVSATIPKNTKLTNVTKNKKEIIPSDYFLIKKKLSEEIKIDKFNTLI